MSMYAFSVFNFFTFHRSLDIEIIANNIKGIHNTCKTEQMS